MTGRWCHLLLLTALQCSSTNALAFATRDLATKRIHIESNFVAVDEGQYEEEDALSSFGTKQYWDDVYAGQGDFPADQYSWYYGYDEIKRHMTPFDTSDALLLPGIGNDSLLMDLVQAGYTDLTAQDYSIGALERQLDLLETAELEQSNVKLSHSDVKQLPFAKASFDGIIEKGLLDAVYLSGEANLEAAIQSLSSCLKPNGILLSVSGVVPPELRSRVFADYEWLRDGTDDLKAGCFVLRKRAS